MVMTRTLNGNWISLSVPAASGTSSSPSKEATNVEDFHIEPLGESFIFEDFDPERDTVSFVSDGTEREDGAFDILPANTVRLTSFGEPLLVPGETLLVETFATGDNPDRDTGDSPIRGAFSYRVTWQLALNEDVPLNEDVALDETAMPNQVLGATCDEFWL
jgi:hypothetical protein